MRLRSILLATSSVSFLLCPQISKAQKPLEKPGLEEIVVTANKRSERLNKVGTTVNAISGRSLATQKIQAPAGLAAIVPGLTFTPTTHDIPVYTLRGVGFNADYLSAYPAVSIYLDQAPLPFGILGGHDLYDLDRVEVLKGPQGTLFGQNSTGGAINYVAAKPTRTTQGALDLSYGRFNDFQADGFISGPLTDTLSGRVAIDTRDRNGWQESQTRSDTNGAIKYFAGRAILDWTPNDALHISLNVNGSIDDTQPQAVQLVSVIPTLPSDPTTAERTTPLGTNDARSADWSTGDSRPHSDRKVFQSSLRIDDNITPDLTVTSQTTFNSLDQATTYDADGSAGDLVNYPQDVGKIRNFDQELRISNAVTSHPRLRVTVGGNYDTNSLNENGIVTYKDNSISNPMNLFIDATGIQSHNSIENYAFFGTTEYDVIPALTLRAGVRYTQSTNDTRTCDYSPDGTVAQLFQILGEVLAGKFVPLSKSSCFTLNTQNLPGTPFVEQLSQNNVSWKVGADYQLSDRGLVYFNAARGFKAGSFPTIPASTFTQYAPVGQESLTSYELGIKQSLLDRRLQVNLALYDEDYKNKQVQGQELDPLFGLLPQLKNVPDSNIKGIEADITARPLDGLALNLGANYQQTVVERYSDVDIYGTETNFKGDSLPYAPKWTVAFSGDYTRPVGVAGDDSAFMGFSVGYHSQSEAYIGGSDIAFPTSPVNRTISQYPFILPSYATLDLRLGYRFGHDHWSVTLLGKNVTNTFYTTYISQINDVTTRTVGEPAIYELTLGYKF